MALLLGLDIGSTTTKAVLVDMTDSPVIVHLARAATPRDATSLVDAAAAVLRDCASRAHAPIAAIGIASMAESGVAVGADGMPLSELLRWDRHVDRRHLDDLMSRHPDLPSTTGIPPTTKPAAVALTALREDRPEVFAAMRHWSGAADLVAHALTGTRATDHTLAARSMLAGARGDGWNDVALASLGVREGALPDVRPPGVAVAMTGGDAGRFGLARGIPVHIAGHDHAVGAWAVGARTPGAVADSLGTAEAVVRVTDAADTASAVSQGLAVGRTVDGSALTILGGSPACGAMLTWWDDAHPQDDALARLAAMPAAPWSVSGTTILPYPAGRQCPDPDPAARVVVGDDIDDPDARVRGLLQSIVLHARWMRETADDLAGSTATSITVVGSLARRIPAWGSLVAAAGVPTFVCTDDEPVAAGAALLAGVREAVASPGSAVLGRSDIARPTASLEPAYRRFLDTTRSEGET